MWIQAWKGHTGTPWLLDTIVSLIVSEESYTIKSHMCDILRIILQADSFRSMTVNIALCHSDSEKLVSFTHKCRMGHVANVVEWQIARVHSTKNVSRPSLRL